MAKPPPNVPRIMTGTATVSAIPRDAVLVETDCPYLAPHPYRGSLNHSGYLEYTVGTLAEIWGVTPAEAAEVLTDDNTNSGTITFKKYDPIWQYFTCKGFDSRLLKNFDFIVKNNKTKANSSDPSMFFKLGANK